MKKYTLLFTILLLLFLTPARTGYAEELTPVTTKENNTIVVTAKDGGKIGAVYIKWDDPVVPYQIETPYGILDCGQNAFLHEFILLDEACETLTIKLPEQRMRIYEIRIFEDGNVPDDVQIWQPPCDRADIIMIPSHADDEILYMGGIIPTYSAEQGARVQVVYMTEFWTTTPVREHEKLDGLWTDGLRTYPVCGNFFDKYAGSRAQALQIYDYQALQDFLIDTFRQFQPQIVVTHDFKGEYGHGFHIITAEAVAAALEAAADETIRTDTDVFASRGVWDVPKAYFHLYKENAIRMDLRVPLESMGGKTALEVAKEAYKKHVSQQKWAFRVADDYAHSCADFGLYRTLVGYDTANSMLDNIVLYDEQERLIREEEERLAAEKARKEEEERLRLEQEALAKLLEAERLEAERLKAERLEAERLEAERLEAERLEAEKLEAERLEAERLEQEALAKRLEEERLAAETAKRQRIILISVAACFLVAAALGVIFYQWKKKTS